MNRPRNDVHWPATQRMTRREDLLNPATQIVADRDAYLGQARNDVGRRVADDQVELFVAGEVAFSLQREFEQHNPEFIAVHDVGTSASLRLLSSLASASGARVQRLMVRRQGHGVALAVLQFVELPLANGALLRMYSTDINSDGNSRQALARVLLGWSRLGVLLIGDLPGHALTAALKPLQESIARGPWPNRELLMVPLGSGLILAGHATHLTTGSPVTAHVTPTAVRPKQIWSFIGGTWNRLQAAGNDERAVETDLARALPRPPVPPTEAATQPMGLQPLEAALGDPSPSSAATPSAPLRTMPSPGGTRWQGYVDRCLGIKGAVSGCVFDTHSLQPLASSGGPPTAERLARQGATLLSAMSESARALGLGAGRTEAAISTGSHHLILRPVPGHPGVALHLVLLASTGNVTLARMQLERIEPPQ